MGVIYMHIYILQQKPLKILILKIFVMRPLSGEQALEIDKRLRALRNPALDRKMSETIKARLDRPSAAYRERRRNQGSVSQIVRANPVKSERRASRNQRSISQAWISGQNRAQVFPVLLLMPVSAMTRSDVRLIAQSAAKIVHSLSVAFSGACEASLRDFAPTESKCRWSKSSPMPTQ